MSKKLDLRGDIHARVRWPALLSEVRRLPLVECCFDWAGSSEYAVSPALLEVVRSRSVSPILYFCHPVLIREQPPLIEYYRRLAGLSICDMSDVSPNPTREFASLKGVSDSWTAIAGRLNGTLSLLVRGLDRFAPDMFDVLPQAAVEMDARRFVRDVVRRESLAAVRSNLIDALRGEILQVVWRDKSSRDYSPSWHTELLDRIGDVRIVRLKEGYHLVFSSEPDVSLRNAQDLPLVAIEVKAGADPAGALERLGAAMKSFDHDRALNPRVKTVYVVRCLTPELHKRIRQSSPFDYTFSLAEILADTKTQQIFANVVLRVILGR